MQIELSATARLECANLIYGKWSEAFDTLKVAKNATWETSGKTCPKSDWPLFRAHNLEHAQKEFDKWSALKEEVCKYSPLVIGE
jgi:hypothetical protein